MIGYRLQAVGELAKLGLELAIAVPAVDVLPTVVENDVLVPQVPQPEVHNLLRGAEQEVLGNVTPEGVPVILFVLNFAGQQLVFILRKCIRKAAPIPWEA